MRKIEKAVILARGLGTRMKAQNGRENLNSEQAKIANLGIKALMPIIGEKTLLDFIFESLNEAGFTEICLVIGEEHQNIRDFCACKPYKISFAIQAKPLGTADAVLSAENFVGDDLFLAVNSDNLYPVYALQKLSYLNQAGLIAFPRKELIAKSNISAEKIAKFAVIELDENDYLQKIIEKPVEVFDDALISMNAWTFSPKIFTACRNIKLSIRGEFELADAVMFAIENLGEKFKVVKSNEGVWDLSNRADIQTVAEKLTENFKS